MFDAFTSLVQRFHGDTVDAVAIIVEFLLIGLSVNWCAGILQGTRGTRPLKGVLMLLVITTLVVRVLAVQLSWTRLELLYRYFLFGLAFAALVAFQPELRRAVIRAGDMRLRPRRGTPQARLVHALVKAVGTLARNRHGALIAIQRGVDLRGWAENGTIINAEVSAGLLCTIFHPKTPLHDLGVILKDARVLAASCQFPVADSDEIDMALGSRHLAALGMSYETDALVIVVSEETGAISLADNGELIPIADVVQLDGELERRLGSAVVGRRERSLRSRAWRVARRLLVVIPLTAIIWYVADQATQITVAGIPVRMQIKADPLTVAQIVEPATPVFTVSLRGTTRAVDRLRALSTSGPIDVAWSAPAVADRYVLQTDEVVGDALRTQGVSVYNAGPPSFIVQVDALATAEMRVRVNPGALRIAEERVDPDTVRVTLRAEDLAQLPESRRIIEARVEERLRDTPPDTVLSLARVPLERTVERLKVVRTEPPEVTVSLRVVGQRTRKLISGVPVQLSAAPQVWKRYDVVIGEQSEFLIDVEVEGDRAALDTLRPQDLRAWVPVTADLFGTRQDLRSVEVSISAPPGVTITGAPRTVRLRLEERAAPVE